jgi:hypothetical protein
LENLRQLASDWPFEAAIQNGKASVHNLEGFNFVEKELQEPILLPDIAMDQVKTFIFQEKGLPRKRFSQHHAPKISFPSIKHLNYNMQNTEYKNVEL